MFKKRVVVNMHFETWFKWPLWFLNDVMDVEEKAPISAELKEEFKLLLKEFELNARWDSVNDGWYWPSKESRNDFETKVEKARQKLISELGKSYLVEKPRPRYPVKEEHV